MRSTCPPPTSVAPPVSVGINRAAELAASTAIMPLLVTMPLAETWLPSLVMLRIPALLRPAAFRMVSARGVLSLTLTTELEGRLKAQIVTLVLQSIAVFGG